MDQLIYIPWFLEQYQQWWESERPLSLIAIEFLVLLMRICSYASQFLPSPSYTIEKIRGVSLTDIRTTCDSIANSLAIICTHFDPIGSLIRVQHMSVAALKARCEGRSKVTWDTLSCAIQVAQKVGIERNSCMDEAEIETRRRVFCNLYIWDR